MRFLILVSLLFVVSCSDEKKANVDAQKINSSSSMAAANSSRIEFPRDEGVHHDKPIEWWYLNSQFSDAVGKKYAFFYCKFSTGRHLVSLYDKAADKTLVKDYYENVNADETKLDLSSITGNWKQAATPFSYSFLYNYDGVTFQAELKANKKPFFPGGDGFVGMGQKGTSFYYALTDLTMTGTLKRGTNPVEVMEISGKAWMDHQWGAWDWANDFTQWKWYSVQLDNGVDLMLFNIYKNKTLVNSHCGYIDKDNNQYHKLPCQLVAQEYYTDSFGAKWPKRVDLELSSLPGTKLTLIAEKEQQFIEPRVLWEGSMSVAGTFKGDPVKGSAFQELNRSD